MFREIARAGNCAVMLVHHTAKPPQGSSDGHAGNPNLRRIWNGNHYPCGRVGEPVHTRKTAGADATPKIAVHTDSEARGFPACGRVDSVDPL
jgi:hypothetical protein